MEEISLTIDGNSIICPPGTSILDAAMENGIRIPTLCHHPHLKPVGACRLCIVEEEKSGRIIASCVTPVSPNMAVQTDSPTIRKHRTNIIRLMMANHPESCIVCNQGNRCKLRQIAAELGVGETGLYPMPYYAGFEEANPFIIRDLSKCILCGKCIRADHELVVVGAIDYNLRGFKSRPATSHEMPLEKSICTFCGTCVSMCPTGALVTKNKQYAGSPQKELPTICGFCSVGCSLVMGSVGDQIVDVNPSHEEGTVNRSTLCVRGHFAHDFLNTHKRLTSPLVRRDSELSPVGWEEALEVVAERLLSIKKQNGPRSLAFLGSSKCTVEENYLFQKMARAVLGSNNVDNGGYLSGRPVMRRVSERLNGTGRVTPLAELEQADLIFAVGTDPTQSAPVAGYYIKRASREKRIPLIVADPRRTGLTPFSTLYLPLLPHSDSELINGLAAILYKREAYDGDFIDRFTEDFGQYRDGLSSLDLNRVSQITGLDIKQMEEAADQLEGKKISFVIGHGVLQQRYGFRAMDALLNLALMTGSLGDKGNRFYFPAMENNEMGAWDMGTVPDLLPGRLPLDDDRGRKNLEQAWKVKLSSDPGLNMIRMIEEAEKGSLKALYIMGENPLRSLPQSERVRNGFDNLDFLVVQDILENETTRLADVVLPGTPFSEKGGSFTNLEGRIQSFEPVAPPRGDAKPDWEILHLLCHRMGLPDRYLSLQEIRAEISRLVPMYSAIGKSDRDSWVKEKEGDEKLIRFTPLISTEGETVDEAYPLAAIFGSYRCHLGSGTRTGASDRVKDFDLKGEAEISRADGKRFGIRDRDTIRISSAHGTIEREVRLVRHLSPGIIFVPKAFHQNDARDLLSLRPLDRPDSPGNKEVRVRIEKK